MTQVLDRFIRMKEVIYITGLSKTQLKEEVKRGSFPAARPLSDSGRSIGWSAKQIAEWQQQRMAMKTQPRAKAVVEKAVKAKKAKAKKRKMEKVQ